MGGVAFISMLALFFGYLKFIEFLYTMEKPEKGPYRFGVWWSIFCLVVLALAEFGLIRLWLLIEVWWG